MQIFPALADFYGLKAINKDKARATVLVLLFEQSEFRAL